MDNSIENYDYYSSGTDYTAMSDSISASPATSTDDVAAAAALGVMILVFL